MSIQLRLELLIFTLILLLIVIAVVRKGYVSLRYSLIWLLSSLLMILFSFFPGIVENVSEILGFEVASNMIFSLIIAFILMILLSLTIIVTHQKEDIRVLTQELSLLKKKVDDKE